MIRSFVQRMGERKQRDFFSRLDPRAKLIAVVLWLGAAGFEREALIGLYVAVAVLAVVSGLWRILVLSTLAGFVMWLGFAHILMPLSHEPVKDPFVLFAGLVLRLTIFTVLGLWFAVKTNLYDFECALEKWKVPSHVVLPFIISIRFVPTLLAEFAAVRDAMRQRGIIGGFGSAVMRPAVSFRYFITPMLIRSLKMADELTVAAETRGIGCPSGRSYYRDVSFGRPELALLGSVTLLIAANDILFRTALVSWWPK